MSARPGAGEKVYPWDVREVILNTGRESALALGRWQQCLDLNAEIIASQRERGAGLYEVMGTLLGSAWPLIQLGRLDEADRLLRQCQQVFEEHRDTPSLATVLGTRAFLEEASGRLGASADLSRAALRYWYASSDPGNIAISHHNLVGSLRKAGGNRAEQRGHLLAAALIWRLTGMTHYLAGAERELAAELWADASADLPATLADVIQVAERTDGVRLGDLLATLQPDTEAVEQALAEILRAGA